MKMNRFLILDDQEEEPEEICSMMRTYGESEKRDVSLHI